MIEVRHLSRRYGRLLALDDVSFTLQRGHIYGFLGPNGAGKTTTMNILAGVLAAAQGSVRIDGWDIFAEPLAAKRLIGYLPEQPPLYPDMTVWEYLHFVAQLKKAPANAAALQPLLARTGLAPVAGRRLGTLSRGYRQRAGIAQALVGDPPVLLLDEPTAGLDPLQQVEVRRLIGELSKRHTVLLSSHILTEAAQVCDDVLILSHGRLVAQDTPARLVQQARGERTSRLLIKGEPQAVRAALQKLPFTGCEMHREEGGLVRVQLSAPAGADLRERLFFALAAARLPLLEAAWAPRTLEDVFLELTGDAAEGDAAEGGNAAGGEGATDKAAGKDAKKSGRAAGAPRGAAGAGRREA